MQQALYPALYQVNTRARLYELGLELGRPATLDDIPDDWLDRLSALGFDWLWLLGIWQTGEAGRAVSRSHRDLWLEYRELLPDVTEDDIVGSPFAVRDYTPHADFGGLEALQRLRERLRLRNLNLMLDFVPNHVAPDHPWAHEHPEYFIHGTPRLLRAEPENYCSVGSFILARGRDPYFPGWPDTLQLNYRHAGLRRAMVETLSDVSHLCDGVRCDMAMLLLPDVIARTWGDLSRPADDSPPTDSSFWPEALGRVRRDYPGFIFMAEVYWGLEWELQQQGFDYTYDKTLYDRLRAGKAEAVRGHLLADLEYQRHCARFLENHDEGRAAANFPWEMHQAAAIITALSPGLRFFHDGQLEGRRLRTSNHLRRRAVEPSEPFIHAFYERLLGRLYRPEVRFGRWQLCDCRAAWEGNVGWRQFICFAWQVEQGRRLLVTVNYGPQQAQCYVALPFANLRGQDVELNDAMRPLVYRRSGDDLAERGLYLDMAPWGYHVFEVNDIGH